MYRKVTKKKKFRGRNPREYVPVRRKALEDFLGEEVEALSNGLYRWGKLYFEVLSKRDVVKRHNWSQFILVGKYYVREATPYVIKTYYPNLKIT